MGTTSKITNMEFTFGLLILLLSTVGVFTYTFLVDKKDMFNNKGTLRKWVWEQSIVFILLLATDCYYMIDERAFELIGFHKACMAFVAILCLGFFLVKCTSIISRQLQEKKIDVACVGKFAGATAGLGASITALGSLGISWSESHFFVMAFALVLIYALYVMYLVITVVYAWISDTEKTTTG